VDQVFVYNPSSQWVMVDWGGTVDVATSAFTLSASLPQVQAGMVCVDNQGTFSVTSYELWQTPSCVVSFSTSDWCVVLSKLNLAGCFAPGAVFQVVVNAAGA
jgi:hypothetical protein